MMMLRALMLLVFASTATAASLDEAYRGALTRMESIASSRELVTQADARQGRARGSVLPNVNFIASHQRQEEYLLPGATSAFGKVDQTTLRLNATQPVFRGLAEYATLRQAGDLKQASLEDQSNMRRLLYLDVVTAFYTALSQEQELLHLDELLDVTKKRAADLESRSRIGRTRPSEVAAHSAQTHRLEAERAELAGLRDSTRAQLEFLTGIASGTPLQDALMGTAGLKGVEEYQREVAARPDLKGAVARASAASEGITVARAGHLPLIDLAGNYYFKRPGVLTNVNWDVTASLTFPLFQGGAVMASSKEAAAAWRSQELTASQARRQAEMEVRQLHATVMALENQVKSLELSVASASAAYKAQVQEYRLGIENNINVLTALDALVTARRSLDRARANRAAGVARLEAAASRGPWLEGA